MQKRRGPTGRVASRSFRRRRAQIISMEYNLGKGGGRRQPGITGCNHENASATASSAGPSGSATVSSTVK
jgi:hypothetical protein